MRRQYPSRDTDDYYDGGTTNPCLPIDNNNYYNEEEIVTKLTTDGPDSLNAEEYILYVRSMTRKVPKVMMSNINPASYFSNVTLLPDKAKKAAYNASNNYGCPAPEWEEKVQHQFHQTRIQLTIYEQTIKSYGTLPSFTSTFDHTGTSATIFTPPPLPKRNDIYSYQYYTLGHLKHKPQNTTNTSTSTTTNNNNTVPETLPSLSTESTVKSTTQIWFAKDDETVETNNIDDSSTSSDSEDVSVPPSVFASIPLPSPYHSSSSSSSRTTTSPPTSVSPGTASNFLTGPYAPFFSTIIKYDQITVIRLIERLYNYYQREYSQFEEFLNKQSSSSSSLSSRSSSTIGAQISSPVVSAVDSTNIGSTPTFVPNETMYHHPDLQMVGPTLPSGTNLIDYNQSIKIMNSSSSTGTINSSLSSKPSNDHSIVLTTRAAIVKSSLLPTIISTVVGSLSTTTTTKDTTVIHHGSIITVPELLWLYSLFIRLDKPILGHMAATIRSLFLLCRKQRVFLMHQLNHLYDQFSSSSTTVLSDPLREKINAHHSHIAAFNTLIVITGKYFEQRLPGEV